jgi:RND superfamily putative drug exporter
VLFVIVLLFLVFRAALAPLAALLPAVASLLLAGPLIAEASKDGLPVSSISQQLLVVLLVGAGTDYGLFLWAAGIGSPLGSPTVPLDRSSRSL